MGIKNKINEAYGTVTVQVEGFFTERFINLCKVQNVKIWDIRQIVSGVVRFKLGVSDFKKLRPIAKKAKCKVVIKDKKGAYFFMFKYRKRRFLISVMAIFILFTFIFSTFIWTIEIEGNNKIGTTEILNELKNSGAFVGKSKFTLSKKDVVDKFRANMKDVSWIGIYVQGTTLKVKIIESELVDKEKAKLENIPGDIVAEKSGIITTIVAENGTAKYKEGSYIEKGLMLIEGVIYSKVMPPENVHAKGIIKVDSEYIFEREYTYSCVVKKYTNKRLFTIGISLNSKENMLNYLNKAKKYDISKSSKSINLFGKNISFDLYRCDEYVEEQVNKSFDELITLADKEAKEYLENEILAKSVNGLLKEEKYTVETRDTSIIYKKQFKLNEDVGVFVPKQ